LLGGITTVSTYLDGFTDTKKHSCHVHKVGRTADQCSEAGERFSGGALGNVTADATGRAVTTLVNAQLSLVGRRNVIGRSVVVSSRVIIINASLQTNLYMVVLDF